MYVTSDLRLLVCSQEISTMAREKDYYALLVIQTTAWITELFTDFIVLISNIGNVESWRMYALAECSSYA